MSVSMATMGKFASVPTINTAIKYGGGGDIGTLMAKKPIVRVKSVRYNKNKDIKIIVLNINKE